MFWYTKSEKKHLCVSHVSIKCTANILKFEHLSVSVLNKILVISVEIHKMLVGIANMQDPVRIGLISVCVVCLCLFGRQLLSKF